MYLFKTPPIVKKLFFNRKWGFPLNKNFVYLTFDDGPHPAITPWVLDELKKHQIKACFFCVGENVARYPELFQRILDEGHQVGNHTMHHDNALKTTKRNYFASIEEAKLLIPSKFFRPPYGRLQLSREKSILKNFTIVMWSWLSYDFDQELPISDILENAKTNIHGGEILVFHDNSKIEARQKELLPKFIALIQEKKLEFQLLPAD